MKIETLNVMIDSLICSAEAEMKSAQEAMSPETEASWIVHMTTGHVLSALSEALLSVRESLK